MGFSTRLAHDAFARIGVAFVVEVAVPGRCGLGWKQDRRGTTATLVVREVGCSTRGRGGAHGASGAFFAGERCRKLYRPARLLFPFATGRCHLELESILFERAVFFP